MKSKQWKFAGVIIAIQLVLTSYAFADVCVANSEKDFIDFLAKAKANPSECLDQNTKLQTISLSITDKDSYLRWRLNSPVVIDVPNLVITSNNRQAIISNFMIAPNAMFDIKAPGVTLDNLIILNNSTALNSNIQNLATNAIVVEKGGDDVHIKNVRVVGDSIKQTQGIVLAGDNAIVSDSVIKLNGNGVIVAGKNNSVLNNKINVRDLKDTAAIVVVGQAPIIKKNSIYGVKAFYFMSTPAIPMSDAANIIRENPSLYYDATGENDEDFISDNNYKTVYAALVSGYTGDLTWCPSPNGNPYYKPGDNYLTCNPPTADQKAAMCITGPVNCPPDMVPDANKTFCIKTVTTQSPNVNVATTPKTLSPMTPLVANQGSGGCSLVREQ